jgi:beclin 1
MEMDQLASCGGFIFRLADLHSQLAEVRAQRTALAGVQATLSVYRGAVDQKLNELEFEKSSVQDTLLALELESARTASDLSKLMKLNVTNDCFYIWFSGPFATINNFRLGKMVPYAVDWPEVNAALGETCLALSVLQSRTAVEFKKYGLVPLGSASKVYPINDKRTQYNLFIDGSFSLFPKRNFNTALGGLLFCVQELGEFISKHDPTIQMPYEVAANDGKIGGHSIYFGNDDEVWTRACKFMLTNVKWMIAWSSKHCDYN